MRTSSWLVMVCSALAACGGGGGSSKPPGDQWFTGVVAGEDNSGTISGTVDLVLLDPANADMRPPGTPGASGEPEVVGGLYVNGLSIPLAGTFDGNSYTASGGGYTFTGTVDGTSTDGGFTGPDGAEGDFGGQDAANEVTGRYCGTYSGDGDGEWNFVVGGDGDVSGAFAGTASGTLEGSVSGATIRLAWDGEALGDPASGKATGTLDSSSAVSGTWDGNVSGDFGGPVGGTWQSDQNCTGGITPESFPPADCPCDHAPLPAAGGCCDYPETGHVCCYSQF